MSFTTNVPQPTLGPNGFVAPTDSVILTGVEADYTAAFGADINPALNTPQGQLETSTTAIISDVNAEFVALTNGVDPAYATGRMQDAIGRIYFLTRNPALPTALEVACGGGVGVVIPVGALINDTSNNIYSCTSEGTIQTNGTVTLGFANQVPGPLAVPNQNDVSIYQAIPGWDTVSVVSGIVGQNVESRAEFEARREATVAANGQGFLDAIFGAVMEVPGVLSAVARENPTGSPVTVQGVTLAAHSLYVAAFGGSAAAIAQAIWTKKDPGCDYNGNTTIDVLDANPGYTPPYPVYPVTFEIPSAFHTCFNVTLSNNNQVPANAASLVQGAVISAFNGTDGGTRAGIGAVIFASRYYCDVNDLGAWAQIETIQVGTESTPDVDFHASIATTTLDVTSITTGTMAVGQFVFGNGVAAGTIVVSQITGSPGSTGHYEITVSQTVTSEHMQAVAAVNNVVTLDLDQIPTLAGADVNVILV